MPVQDAEQNWGGIPQVGTDQFTEALPQHLRATGCELQLLRQVGGPTGTAVILLQPDGAPGTLGSFHQAVRQRLGVVRC
jgi:hypothetical protein